MATLSKTRLWKRSRKSWKTMPMTRRRRWTLWSGRRRMFLPADEDLAVRGDDLAGQGPQQGRLAGAGGAGDVAELAPARW